MSHQYEYELTETGKALQVAQMLVEQGNMAAAEPIFKNILEKKGNLTLEGALCLSNLAQIAEARGDIRAAVDCNLKLFGCAQEYKPIPHALKQAHARRAAELLLLIGQTDEAERLLELAGRPPEEGSAPGDALLDREQDSEWLMDSLKDAAFKVGGASTAGDLDFDHGPSPAGSEEPEPPSASGIKKRTIAKATGSGRKFAKSDGSEEPSSEKNGKTNKDTGLGSVLAGLMGKMTGQASSIEFDPRGGDDSKDASLPQVVKKGSKPMKAKGGGPASVMPGGKDSRPKRKGSKEFAGPSSLERPAGPGFFSFLSRIMPAMPAPKSNPAVDIKYSEPQKLAHEVVKHKDALNGFYVLISIVIAFVAAWNLAPRAGNGFVRWNASPHRLIDAEQDKQIWLISPHEVELVAGSKRTRTRLQYYFGDWREVLILTFGRLIEKYGYINEVPNGLVDQDGTRFYKVDGPEAKLGDRAQEIAAEADEFFVDTGRYPRKLTELKGYNWSYVNPYSKKKVLPVISSETFGAGGINQMSEDARTEMYTSLDSGTFWDNKTLQTGTIYCYNGLFRSTRGDIDSFIVTAAGADGKPLDGSSAGSAFYLASEDGRQRHEHRPKPGNATSMWIIVEPIDQSAQFLLQNGACFFFGLSTLAAIAVGLSRSKKDRGKPFWFIGAAFFLLVSVLYLILSHIR